MADVKISALALIAAASITATDRMVLVDDISGTPTTYQATLADIRTALFAGGAGFASDPLSCAALTATTVNASGLITASAGLTVANAQTLTLTGATVVGQPTWSSSQAMTITGSAATLTTTRTIWGQNFNGSANVTGAMTYGGVTLTNSVTGTGSMVLSASPTFTGTVTAPFFTASTRFQSDTIADASGSRTLLSYSAGDVFVASSVTGTVYVGSNTSVSLGNTGSGTVTINGSSLIVGAGVTSLCFYGGTPTAKQTVTGSRGGNAALASLLTKLATFGLIADGSSA